MENVKNPSLHSRLGIKGSCDPVPEGVPTDIVLRKCVKPGKWL